MTIPSSKSPHSGKPVHILLVEDSATHIALIRDALAARGREIALAVAHTLAEARTMLAGVRPDLAIVDLLLPDGSGIDLLPADREDAAFPVVILTSHGNERKAVEAIKAGALDYLVKSPDTLAALPHVVTRALREWNHIVERKRAEDALRESEERFRSVFEHAASGMAMLSLDGRFLQVNQALCRFLGYSEAELLNLRVEDVTLSEDREWMHRLFDEIRTGSRKAFDYEKRYVRKDGTFVWGHATVAQVRNSGAQPDYCVGMVQDITDGKKAEEALRESDRMKTEFISTAAHELRTPLTSILGFSQVLLGQDDLSAAERRELLTYIHQQARALSDIVADLLDIARIESGQGLALNRVACMPADLVQQLAPLLQGGSGRPRYDLSIAEETAPLLVDLGKMIQVFENLLSNAVKYSPKGGPIRIAGELMNEMYRFSVADRGVGMTPEQVARIFDKFYRADASDTAVGGLGLGMSIARNIVEAHGGRIWVESEPGRGTTVRFTLPLGRRETSGNGSEVEENPDR